MSTVAIVTSQLADEAWVFDCLDGGLVVVDAAPYADVIVVSEDCLGGLVDHLPATLPVVVLGEPTTPPPRATHVITRTWPADQLRALLTALASGQPLPQAPLAAPSTPGEAQTAQRVIAAGRKLATVDDLAACEAAIVEILIELVDLDRAYWLYFDHGSRALWSEAKLHGATGDDRTAATGLAGFAALTGIPTVANRAGDDPRFVGGIDDPAGDAADRLVVQPVHGSDGAIHGVLIGARRARRAPIGAFELGLLARFARLVTPVLDQLSIHVQAQEILDDASAGSLFRKAATEAQGGRRWGDVVRVSPPWISWAYRLLVVLLIGSAVFISVAEVATYSSGPFVIRSTARTPVTSRTSGNIVAVTVATGDPIVPGSVIARLDDADQQAAVTRLEHEFETRLRNHLLDPTDAVVDGALHAVRTELETARGSLEARLIRATSAGTVGDLRVRAGQHLAPGDIVASVLDRAQRLEVVALLPGEDRPQLAPGMTIRLELTGYRYAYQSIVIESISSDVIAPAEARRVLGAEVAEGLNLPGSVMLVRGKLPSSEFVVDGQTFHYHDGMVGLGEVRVRSEPIIFALVPGTRRFQ